MRKQKQPATQEQIKIIEKAVGEPIGSFVHKFSNADGVKLYSQNLYAQLRKTQDISQRLASTGSYQPILSEQYNTSINLNPLVASSEQLEDWLKTPQYHSEVLRGLSQYLSFAVGQYKSLIEISNSGKAFNYILVPSEVGIEEDIDSEEYIKDYNIALNTCKRLNIKYQMAKADLVQLFDGAVFYYIKETKQSLTLIQLPTSFCYIVAPYSYGWQFAVDLSYFDKFIGLADYAIPELGEAYKKFVEARKQGLKGDELAPVQYYPMSVTNSVVFTSDIVHSDVVPPMSSSMMSALDILSYKQLLKNKLIFELYKVIALKIPLDKDNKKMILTYEQAKEMVSTIQSQLPENINVYASPFDSESINTNQVDNLQSIVNLGSNSIGTSSGTPEELLGSTGLKQGTSLKYVGDINFTRSARNAYLQYENFINFQIAIRCKKYKFQIKMFGNEIKKIEEQKHYAELFRTTNLPPDFYLASLGLEPHQMAGYLMLNNKLDLKKYMTPIVSAFNTKGGVEEQSKGQPIKSNEDLAEGGEIARDYE